MTDDAASLDSPLIQQVLDLEEKAARLLREAETEAESARAAVLREVAAMRASAAEDRKRRVEALEREAHDVLGAATADADARHAAVIAAVDGIPPERREAAVEYLLTRLKSASP